MTVQPVDILLIEDNQDDIELTREALTLGKVVNTLTVVRDGQEALRYLFGNGSTPEKIPGLILLDLRLPGVDGIEVLKRIKQEPILRRVPVVVLTTSKDETDVLKAYGLHANCYVVKPVDFEKFVEVVKCIENFWFSVVTLP